MREILPFWFSSKQPKPACASVGAAFLIASNCWGLLSVGLRRTPRCCFCYDRIKLGNDLVADILPPPKYVIEAYLEATLALRNPATLADHRERLVQLRKDYDERRDFWSKANLDPLIKTMLVEKSDAEVRKFWTSVEQGLLPALAEGNAESAAGRGLIAAVSRAQRAALLLIGRD